MVGPEEQFALQVVLGGIKDGLALLPAESTWTGALRDAATLLAAQTAGLPDLEAARETEQEDRAA